VRGDKNKTKKEKRKTFNTYSIRPKW